MDGHNLRKQARFRLSPSIRLHYEITQSLPVYVSVPVFNPVLQRPIVHMLMNVQASNSNVVQRRNTLQASVLVFFFELPYTPALVFNLSYNPN